MNIVDRYRSKHTPYKYDDVKAGDVIRVVNAMVNDYTPRLTLDHIYTVESATKCSRASLDDCESDGDVCPSHGMAITLKEANGYLSSACDCKLANEYGIELII